VETYKTFKAGESLKADEGSVIEDKYAYRASLKEIEENDYNLNIPRYVDTFEEEEPVDIVQTQKEISRLKSELLDVENQMNEYLKELGF
jgi:type I restriction enzyme M protein